MAWTTPPTFVAGTVVTAAQLNILSDDLLYLYGIAQGVTFSGAHIARGANQSISTSTDTSISFDTEVLDFGGWWSSGTALTVPAGAIPDGYTSIMLLAIQQVKFASNATGKRNVGLLRDGSSVAGAAWKIPALDDDTTDIILPAFATAVAGQTFGLQVWQNSGGNLNVTQARLSLVRYAPLA